LFAGLDAKLVGSPRMVQRWLQAALKPETMVTRSFARFRKRDSGFGY